MPIKYALKIGIIGNKKKLWRACCFLNVSGYAGKGCGINIL
jgi:hypothetical protein